MGHLCKFCKGEHELMYLIQSNNTCHLTYWCPIEHKIMFLPYEKDLPIPTRFSKNLRKKRGIEDQIALF